MRLDFESHAHLVFTEIKAAFLLHSVHLHYCQDLHRKCRRLVLASVSTSLSSSQIHITNLPNSRICYCEAYNTENCSISFIRTHCSLVAYHVKKVLQIVLRLVQFSSLNYRPIVMVMMFAEPLALARFTNNQLQSYTFSKFFYHMVYVPLICIPPCRSLHKT